MFNDMRRRWRGGALPGGPFPLSLSLFVFPLFLYLFIFPYIFFFLKNGFFIFICKLSGVFFGIFAFFILGTGVGDGGGE